MLPHNWKLADITPLHKKGAKNVRKNYRPVSLTSVVSKMCEMMVRQQFWITNEVFLPEQFDFLKGKSCLSQLLPSFHNWALERNNGLTPDVIFLDLSKAYDSVPHERLLTKIHAYGIQGPVLSCLRCFLPNQYQRVVLREHHTSWTSVMSGVPQGAVLGPILFLIYINDISRNIMSDTKLFTDDMKVYRVLGDTKEDVEELQKDLTRLESWSNDWQLKFNTDKCVEMGISKKNDYSSPQYHLCGNQLKAVSEVKDLRIYITSNLSWSIRANKCANKADNMLVRRAVGPKNPELFPKLYKSLVRPILEHCSPVWCPQLKKDSNTLEKVQRRASKCALGNIG